MDIDTKFAKPALVFTRGIIALVPVIILCLFVTAALVRAQKSAKAPDCLDTAQTQGELNECAGGKATQADRKLNQTYQAVLKKYADKTVFIDRLRKAQRAWVTFRDAQLEMKFPSGEAAGSVEPMCYSLYKAELTEKRSNELREWLKGIEEGDVCCGSIKTPEELK
jgi:uncharacterized protein YecT (DUF1311 family)